MQAGAGSAKQRRCSAEGALRRTDPLGAINIEEGLLKILLTSVDNGSGDYEFGEDNETDTMIVSERERERETVTIMSETLNRSTLYKNSGRSCRLLADFLHIFSSPSPMTYM